MNITIRQETPQDMSRIEEVIKHAFLKEPLSDQNEHHLVRAIRQCDGFIPELSLVALDETETIVGHLLLSKINIVKRDHAVDSLALAPVSIIPEYQRKGIGSMLIREALQRATTLGYSSVIVLGHEDYYPRFGFKPASHWGIKAPFDVPDESFMALPLNGHSLDNIQGVVHYPEAFNS
ncbi:GCN5 family N-acetyltransferase [Pontibacillus halophilus JSM 076056 = DSM 19796]|uniref:GCN5 family N-acetyltransferase n=1 Tax=Pontibacillus halophilus JSM 076056 = DSM 19796 TaxID=1385510 RepID=A0A0A5GFM9_9BACI|nr:N-acetyltransferase [Pontibacillus halophilus]KGX92021.1 GCN5 family N-acetyltransferase [Pontibacillus halophilus JSM 076056 = DSM 19796]